MKTKFRAKQKLNKTHFGPLEVEINHSIQFGPLIFNQVP